MKLTNTESLFVAEYLGNGGNGTRAYLAIKPTITPRAASVAANRLLKRMPVKEAIESWLSTKTDGGVASREHLITEADEIGKEARQVMAFGAALNAVHLKAKLNRLYEKEAPDTNGYEKLIQALQVNVTISNPVEQP